MNRNPYAAPGARLSDAQTFSGDLDKLSAWVIGLLSAQLVVVVIALVSGALEFQLLRGFEAGTYETEAAATAAAEKSDQRQQIIAIIQVVIYLAAGILILVWTHKANSGARRQGANDMQFTPGWAVGWHFIPFANLWKPYQAMKEIWQASANPGQWQSVEVPALLPAWWTLWVITNFLSNASFRSVMRVDDIDSAILANTMTLAADAIDVPLCAVFIVIVRRVSSMQRATQREHEEPVAE
jgi:hypothetical protein